ncbi:DNA-3-methyladenine glycosylase I, partial [Streptomyces hirsutus]|uniref:DNA-3-methyladenine glycosylase I n=1 Tax=Streptomyces hirsutus TaxID=35620 RepID=UPI0033D67891
MTDGAALAGPDGAPRCPWALSTEDYVAYHDEEWGRPVHGDDALFERLSLEAFQSGLSWLTILRRRPGFCTAFAGFRIAAVAEFTDADRERLLADAGIIRNRAKIDATLGNARVLAGCEVGVDGHEHRTQPGGGQQGDYMPVAVAAHDE